MYSRKGWLKESAEIETSADGFLFLFLFISQGEEKVLFLPVPTMGSLNSVMSFSVTRNNITSPFSFLIGPRWNRTHIGVPERRNRRYKIFKYAIVVYFLVALIHILKKLVFSIRDWSAFITYHLTVFLICNKLFLNGCLRLQSIMKLSYCLRVCLLTKQEIAVAIFLHHFRSRVSCELAKPVTRVYNGVFHNLSVPKYE